MSLKKYIAAYLRAAWFKAKFCMVASSLAGGRFICRWKDRWPCLDDATGTTDFDAHYVYHTAWAARILAQFHPVRHVDIGSCLRFATLVSAFVPVEFYDYRPAKICLSGLTCGHADVTALPFADASIDSLSCMHVVEHIGLERYGDPFDPQGDLKGIQELIRVLAPGGQLIFVVPIGGEARIQYNAHRIYTYGQILDYFAALSLDSFAFITDSGQFLTNAAEVDTLGQKYGCGCFRFLK
jgi:SAM-dependent methyltransferase